MSCGARAVAEGLVRGRHGGRGGGTLFVEGEGVVAFEVSGGLVVAFGGVEFVVRCLGGWTDADSLFYALALT